MVRFHKYKGQKTKQIEDQGFIYFNVKQSQQLCQTTL